MKRQILFTLFIFLFINLSAQDIIFTRKGEEIKSKVLEITPDLVKYKKFDNLEGPQYSMKKSNVFMIKYQNGSKDIFDNETATTPSENPTPIADSVKKSFPINRALDVFKKEHGKPYILYDYQVYTSALFSTNTLLFYGLDFSDFTFVSDNNKGAENELKNSFIEWNQFFDELMPTAELKKLLKFNNITTINSPIKLSYNSLGNNWITSFPYNISIEQVVDIVKNYKASITETSGVGFVLIVESFNENTGMVTAIPTFFNLNNFEIIWVSKIQEKAGSVKNRNRWSYGLKKVLNTYSDKVYMDTYNSAKYKFEQQFYQE